MGAWYWAVFPGEPWGKGLLGDSGKTSLGGSRVGSFGRGYVCEGYLGR